MGGWRTGRSVGGGGKGCDGVDVDGVGAAAAAAAGAGCRLVAHAVWRSSAPARVKPSKSVADARAVEGPAFSVDEPSELLKSVAETRAVEGPALSVDEPSE